MRLLLSPVLPLLVSFYFSPVVSKTDFSWAGVNSFYLHALCDNDQDEIIANLRSANIKTIRIFLSSVGAGAKGSSSTDVFDIEQVEVGHYDDTILQKVDALMSKLYQNDMKIIITLHDRYSLGCWAIDAYVDKYDLPVADDCGTAANEPTNFYSNSSAVIDFDNRIQHILSHENPYFENRTWASLGEVIYAFDIENESQAYMETKNSDWMCGRAQTIKSMLAEASGIYVGTGGGGAFEDSLDDAYFQCPYIDIVSMHSYAEIEIFPLNLQTGLKLADQYGKIVVFEEFGHTMSKGQFFSDVFAMTNFYKIPSMPWQVMKPDNPADFEFYVEDKSAWQALITRAGEANGDAYTTGAWCSQHADCASNCCSNIYSDNSSSVSYGRLMCIDPLPLSARIQCNAPLNNIELPDGTFCSQSQQCLSLCCSLNSSIDAMVCISTTLSLDSITSKESSQCLYP